MNSISPEAKLLLAFGVAKDAWDVEAAIEEHGKSRQRPVGGIENNCGMIEVMNDPRAALYERVMNGFDTNIELLQDGGAFGEDVKLPIDAMRAMTQDITTYPTNDIDEPDRPDTYIGRDPGVFVVHTTNNGVVTVTVADTGKGIVGEQFPNTILSLGGSNKIKNNLLCGRYNMGGSATFNFCDRTIIVSCPISDDRIYFTVVERAMLLPENKNPTYTYLTDVNDQIFSCLISELPPDRVRDITKMNNNDVKKDAYVRLLLPPSHGTVIRHVNYRLGISGIDLYKQLRSSGFGIPLPVRYMHTTNNNNKYTIFGLRCVLDNDRRAAWYPVIYTPPRMMGHELVVNKRRVGEIGIKFWIMKSTTGKNPTAGRLLKEAHGLFVTLNGHTHKELTTRTLLRNDFPLLDQHIIIEVDCDRIDALERGNLFSSNRQDIKSVFEDSIKQRVLAMLKSDPRVAQIHREFRDSLRDTNSVDNTSLIDEINLLLDSPQGGILTSSFGATSNNSDTSATEPADSEKSGSSRGGGGYNSRAPIDINDPPTRLKLIGSEIIDDKENGDFIKS